MPHVLEATTPGHAAGAAMSRPVIAVLGTAGGPGLGLVRALLADPHRRFEARALPRWPDTPAALAAALQGAHGAFAMADGCSDRADALALAAARARVAHVVWSALEPTRAFVDSGVPATLLLGSFTWEELVRTGLAPAAQDDAPLAFRLPFGARSFPGIAAADLGACAFTIFASREEAFGKTVGAAAEITTGARMAAELAGVLVRPVEYAPAARAQPLSGVGSDVEALAAARCVACTRELCPGVRTFAAWLAGERTRLRSRVAEAVQ